MNHIYRNVWNEVTRTYVAAAEIVRGRGKRSKSSAGAEGAEAALAASSLLTDGGTQAQAPPTVAIAPKAAPQSVRPATPKRRKLTMSLPRPMALEQRFMFDGAAFGDAVQVMERNIADTVRHVSTDRLASRAEQRAAPEAAVNAPAQAAPSRLEGLQLDIQALLGSDVPAKVQAAALEAQRSVNEFLTAEGAGDQVFALFSGGLTQPDAAWQAAFEQLLADMQSGNEVVKVELRSHAELGGAYGAFTSDDGSGKPTVYLNADWAAGGPSAADIASVLTEEIGHYVDARLNAGRDTAGDEGERFAYRLGHGVMPSGVIGSDDDHTTLSLDGRAIDVETASLTFPGTGLGNSTDGWGAYKVITGVGKESNLHTYNPNPAAADQIVKVVITDALSAREFSGNDVSVLATFTFGNGDTITYAGWVSRPVKSGGQVQGFFFWTDTDFAAGNPSDTVKLDRARADGNNDADRESDNQGFLIAFNRDYFKGSGESKQVGSSSDRVDAALNSLLAPNTAPTPVNDVTTVVEDSTSLGAGNTGNVLTNDTDANGDSLSVTSFNVGSTTGTVGTPLTVAGVGTFTLTSAGAYTFVPSANYAGPVPVVTYTVSDGTDTATATLSISITPVNDPPAGADKTVTLAEDTSYTFTAADFGFTDTTDTPANSLLAVKISTLPTNGSLTLNNVAVTTGQTITLANLTNLKFTPAANGNGSPYATFTFQVQDNGGTANGGIDLDASPNTITLNVTAVNNAPTGIADTATIGEAGGVNNGTNPTPTVTGNVLGNDTDIDTGDTKSVTAVVGLNSGTVGASVAGRYGSLVLDANGSFTYTLDNSNPAVQALRTANISPSEVFTYTVSDSAGLSSTTTLTITVTPANDFPVAQDDYNAVKEGATATSGVWGSVTAAAPGVLANDSDVDGGTLVVESVSTSIPVSQVLSVSSPITSATVTAVDAGGANWTGNNGIANQSSSAMTVKIGSTVVNRTDNGQPLTVYRSGTGNNAVLIFNHPLTLYQYSSTTVFGVEGSTSLFTIGTITPTVASSTVLDVTSGTIANVQVGYRVSGTDIPTGVTVTAVNPTAKTVTLSQAVQIDKRDITFSSATATTTSTQNITAGSSTTLTGNYGNLVLSSSGAYTYNLTNNSLNDGQTATESFTYTVNDSAGGTTTAVLRIRIDGRSAVTVTATDDARSVNEETTLNEAARGVLTNDSDPTNSTVSSYTWGSLTTSINSPVTYENVGTLTLNDNGSFTFVPATNFNGAVPPVVYTISNGAGRASAVLSITVNAVNDAPAGVVDTATAREAGGYDNATAGVNPTGNVLTNDTDVDSGDSKTVSALAGGSVNVSRAGTYGDLLLQADGSYTYTVRNGDTAVQALNQGTSQTDTFTYTVRDSANATSTATLTVTINGANDAPVNAIGNATRSLAEYETLGFTGANALTVSDPESNFATTGAVTVSVGNGKLTATNSGTAAVSGSGSATLTISRANNNTALTKADIDTVLAGMVYTPSVGFTGSDLLRMSTTDTGGLVDVDTVAITVNSDNRPLTVTGTTVNEASPFVLFKVTGAATGQRVSLELGTTGTGTGHAEGGADFLTNLEYFSGTAWTEYTGGLIAIPATVNGGGANANFELLVRTPVVQDQAYETTQSTYETLKLTARNAAAYLANSAGSSGNSQIKDDGTGDIYLGDKKAFTPSSGGDSGYPTYLDDDRPVTVNSIAVNEGSPKAVFTVTGNVNQVIKLNLVGGSAKVENGTAPVASDGSEDFGPAMEISTGGGWVPYTADSPYTMTGTTLLVRTAIHQDTLFEGQEAFFLKVTRASSGTIVNGTGNIYDDGTGTKFPDVSPGTGPAPVTETTNLDDDRTVSVDSPLVNEGSDYVVFTVTGNSGQTASLALVNESVGGTVAGKANVLSTITENSASVTNLKIFTGTDSNGAPVWQSYDPNNLPTFDKNGKFFVRVDIKNEQDAPYEGAETFKLNATVTGQSTAATGTATIIDDGTGDKYPGTFTSEAPTKDTTNRDDDRNISVSAFGPVNEASTYAMFTVTSTPGQSLDLSLQNATSGTAATWAGFTPIEFSTDGTTWSTYNSTSNPAVKPTVPADGKVYVRVTITSEADNVYEGSETFALKASWTSNATITSAANTSIIDDGTGTKYPGTITGGNPTTNTTSLDDDRPVYTISDANAVEGNTITFTVTRTKTATVNMTVDYATSIVTGSNTASANDFTSTSGKLTFEPTETSKTFTVPTVGDAVQESDETFTVTLSNASTNSSIGTATAQGTILDDDGPPSFIIGNASIAEGGLLTFTITRLGDAQATQSVSYFTTLGTSDTASQNDFTETQGTVIFSQGESAKTITVQTTDDKLLEADETLTVKLTSPTGGANISTAAGSGTGTILNDDPVPSFSVGPATVTEGGTLVFTITRTGDAQAPQSVSYSTALATGDTASANDFTSAAGTFTFAQGEATKTFEVPTTADKLFEPDETLSVLLANPTGGATISAEGGSAKGTIVNDDPAPSFSVQPASAVEGGLMTVTVTRSGDAAVPQSVSYATSIEAGDTTAATDFESTKGQLTFEPGETSKTFTIQTTTDKLLEGDEVLTITLSAPTAGSQIAPGGGTAKGTIIDDDGAPVFLVSGGSALEGGTIVFTVTRVGDAQAAQTVQFSTQIGTGDNASAADFTAVNETLTFQQGDSTKTISVTTLTDALIEPDETFTAALSNATGGATVSPTDGTAKGTIRSEDLAVNSITVNEGSPFGVFTITGAPKQPVTLQLNGGTATLGVDFGPGLEVYDGKAWVPYTGGPVSLLDNGTLAVRTPIRQDTVFEGAEPFTLNVVNASGKASVGTGTIVDDGTGDKFPDAPPGPDGKPPKDDLTPKDDDRLDAVDDAFTLTVQGSSAGNIIQRNDKPSASTQLSIQAISYVDGSGATVTKTFGSLDSSSRSGFTKQATLADGTLFINADGQTLYEHGGRRFGITAISAGGTLEVNRGTAGAENWVAVPLNQAVVMTLDEIASGRLRYTPSPGSADLGQPLAAVARVVELDWRTDGFSYTLANAGGATDTASVSYTVEGPLVDRFLTPIAPPRDADVDGIVTEVESVLANRARGLPGVQARPYVLDVNNLAATGSAGEALAKIGPAFDGDLNIDLPKSIGDGFQNAVTTFSWINSTFFDAANSNPYTSDVKAVVNLVAEDTGTSSRVPDPTIQLRNIRVDPLTQEQRDRLQSLFRFTPNWSPMGFSAELRSDAPAGVTNIDQDPSRPGFQWRFTVDISRTGETVNTFMAFVKWVDQATIDAYRAANLPLVDLTGDPITKPGWVDFTRVAPGGDGVSIGVGNGNVLLLDYTITDNAFGDMDLRPGYITDPGMPVFIVRSVDVTGTPDVAEGSNAVFSVKLDVPKYGPTEVKLNLADAPGGTDSQNGVPLDYSGTFTAHYFDAAGVKQNLPVSNGSVTLPAKVTDFFVSVSTIDDLPFEGPEAFALTASLAGGITDTDTAIIVDDGSGKVYSDRGVVVPGARVTDDRPLSVNNIAVSESSPFAVFTVTGQPRQLVTLALESGTATVGTDTGTALQFFDGTAWRDYAPGSQVAIPAGGNTLLVRVAIVNDLPLEGPETFRLVATNTGGSAARGTGTIFDDGTNGNVFDGGNTTGRPTQGVADDDTPPPPPPPPPPPAPAPAPRDTPPAPPAPAPVPAPAPAFDSAVSVTKPSSLPIPDRPSVGEIVTSASGFQVRVMQSETPALMRDKGITDQFVDPGRVTTFNLPNDAFAHTRAEAIMTVIARLPNGQPLPPWILFNPQAGTFTVTPPPGFTGQVEIQVIARDNDGREAAANFKFNVGTGVVTDENRAPAPPAPPPPQGRLGVTDQIRLAGRSGGLLDRVMNSRAVQERLQERTKQLAAERGLVLAEDAGKISRSNAAPARLAAERVQPTAAPRPGA